MKQLIVASLGLFLIAGTAGAADPMFWVVGNLKTNRCQIVTSNPVIDGDIWFGDGPYKSKDDAKIAINGISACPPYNEKIDG